MHGICRALSYRRVINSLLIDLSYASSRLEDVRISWLGTKTLIELGERPAGLTDREHRIVMNHNELRDGGTLGTVSPMGRGG